MVSRKLESFTDLLEAARRFRDERDWEQFHSPKNLSAAIAIEAAELQEVFLWQTAEPASLDPDLRRRVVEELADILIHCANLALALDIDIPEALAAKFEENSAKYPIEKSRGNATKYTDL